MATWKKLVVSGSNISQLINDSGYVSASQVTNSIPNSFSTASLNGVSLLADNITGSLNFASSSGQGLTISASAGNDTLTFGLSAIPNASLANSSITIAGNSTALGGTVTQAQILAGSGAWSGSAQITGGIVSSSVLSSPSQGNALLTTNGVAGSTVALGLRTTDSPQFVDLTLTGNLTVQGTTTSINTTNINVADAFILVASGSTNNSTDGGIVIDRGAYGAANTALGYDAATFRWGLQNGLGDLTNTVDLGAASGGVSGSFLAHVFTEATHGATKPVTGEFAVAGAIYTATSGDIFIYS